MRGYSEDLRKRIVIAVRSGIGKSEVARRYGINRSTVYVYLAKDEAGDLKAKSPPGRPQMLSSEQLIALAAQVDRHKDKTLAEHAELFELEQGIKLGVSTVDVYFKRLGITRKKRRSTPVKEMTMSVPRGGTMPTP